MLISEMASGSVSLLFVGSLCSSFNHDPKSIKRQRTEQKGSECPGFSGSISFLHEGHFFIVGSSVIQISHRYRFERACF